MARDAEKPTSSEKGKAKATEQVNGVQGGENGQKNTDGVNSKDGTKVELPEGKTIGEKTLSPFAAFYVVM